MSAAIIAFPNKAERESVRLHALIDAVGIDGAARELGDADEWAWSSIAYLKGILPGPHSGGFGGSINVSAAAVAILLGYVERLEIGAGVIPAPGGVS